MLGLVNSKIDCPEFSCWTLDGAPVAIFGLRPLSKFYNGFSVLSWIYRRAMDDLRLQWWANDDEV
jgi:hypothetical protein